MVKYNKWTSRKFWLGLMAFLTPIINHYAGQPLSSHDLTLAVIALVGYILAETGVDVMRMKGK